LSAAHVGAVAGALVLVACVAAPVEPGRPRDVRAQRIPEYEVLVDCVAMAEGDVLRWRFRTDVPVDFAIEFQDGAARVQPVSREQVTADEGRFVALASNRYCLQWGTGGRGATLDYAIDLARGSK
jgi:hypothetical protein